MKQIWISAGKWIVNTAIVSSVMFVLLAIVIRLATPYGVTPSDVKSEVNQLSAKVDELSKELSITPANVLEEVRVVNAKVEELRQEIKAIKDQ